MWQILNDILAFVSENMTAGRPMLSYTQKPNFSTT
jgi:hypothetical protein